MNRYTIIIIVIVFIIAGLVWVHVSAPCQSFRNNSIRDVPARCLQGYTEGGQQ